MNTKEKIKFTLKSLNVVKTAKADLKRTFRALKDLYISIKNNLSQIEFNKKYLFPYGILRLILIVNQSLYFKSIKTFRIYYLYIF